MIAIALKKVSTSFFRQCEIATSVKHSKRHAPYARILIMSSAVEQGHDLEVLPLTTVFVE